MKPVFIRPGKPVENAYIESFNGKFRDECLNEHWFVSIEDAQLAMNRWRLDYNTVRPHSALGNRTPEEIAQSFLVNTMKRSYVPNAAGLT